MKTVKQAGCAIPDLGAQASLKKKKHPPQQQQHAGAAAFMSGDVSISDASSRSRLDAFDDARELVRLIQCPLCSRPFRIPVVTLPCGYSVCRKCLPTPHRRENITYPNTPDRQQGIRCPVPVCGAEHVLGECGNDVCLSKVMETIRVVLASWKGTPGALSVQTQEICDGPVDTPESEKIPDEPRSYVSDGGKLSATFGLAEEGGLLYPADCSFQLLAGTESECRALDSSLLSCLQENTYKELECRVCYYVMYDPVTTPCGHTFCRKCLARVLDHSTDCPMCRQVLPIPLSLRDQPSNKLLISLLNAFCLDQVLLREQAIQAEERGVGELDTSVFVCTLAYPGMPTYLHIFEPRYRLMIRRALESNRQFGMVMYNRAGTNQGDLGPSHFMQYGTMLTIVNYRMLPDGRSLLETRGAYRFKVKASATLDGYTVGSVERVEDIGIADEERLEAEELRNALSSAGTIEGSNGAPPHSQREHALRNVNAMTTTELWETGIDFIRRMQSNSAPWLHQRILDAYGGPPEDPAMFPYWFASIIPIAEEEKYRLLQITSVRERLKVVVGWIRRIESQRWNSGGACLIL